MSGDAQGSFVQTVNKLTEDYCAAVAGLREEVNTHHKTQAERMQKIELRVEEMLKEQKKLPAIPQFGEFDPMRLKFSDKEPDGGREAFNTLLRCKPVGNATMVSLVEELQKASDEFYIVSAFKSLDHMATGQGGSPPLAELLATKTGRKFSRMTEYLRNALDTATSGEGSQWIPTGMSAQVMAKIALELRVASLFRSFEQPTPSFDWPYATALPVAKKVSQNTTVVADPYGNELAIGNMAFGAGEPTGKVTFTLAKLRALQLITREFGEDAIIATLPWVIDQIAYAIASGWDDACVNGDTAGTHMDNDTTGAANVKKAIDGLRDYVLGSGGIGASGTVDNGGSALGTGSINKLRSVRVKMGTFGVQLDRLAWIVSTVGSIHLLNMPEVLTVDKYGAGATILTGELARIDSSPVILSGYQRDNVAATGVNTAGGPNTFTSIVCVHRPNWMWGTKAGLGVETERVKLTDQSFAVMYDRRSFKYVGAATDTCVGILINIPNTL